MTKNNKMTNKECWIAQTHIEKCARCKKIYRKYCKFVGVETKDGCYWCETHKRWEKAG